MVCERPWVRSPARPPPCLFFFRHFPPYPTPFLLPHSQFSQSSQSFLDLEALLRFLLAPSSLIEVGCVFLGCYIYYDFYQLTFQLKPPRYSLTQVSFHAFQNATDIQNMVYHHHIVTDHSLTPSQVGTNRPKQTKHTGHEKQFQSKTPQQAVRCPRV